MTGSGLCVCCQLHKPKIRRPSTAEPFCCDCFFNAFELEIHYTIINQQLFNRGDRVAVAVSGGKDSTVLAHLMTTLNRRYDYGLDLFLLAVDEGIRGYRDDSLETVKRNEVQFGIPLKVVSYKELYGWTMDAIVNEIGKKNNCTFCGVFRRQALDRGAGLMEAHKICTGHNADDCAETVLMNILRGDIGRFARCSDVVTGRNESSALPRCKPLMFAYEKEIVLYAHFKQLDYFSTECIYSPNAYRGQAREFIKALEASNPQLILAILVSVTQLEAKVDSTKGPLGRCKRCGWMSSNDLCKACVLLDGLNRRNPQIALSNRARQLRPRKRVVIKTEEESGT